MAANDNLRRAVELARDGDLKSALAEVKQALELEPGHQKGLVFRFTLEARLLRRERRFGDAAVRYHAVLALDPENREAQQMLRAQAKAAASSAQHQPRADQPVGYGEGRGAATPSGSSSRASERPTLPPPPADAAIVTEKPVAPAAAQDLIVTERPGLASPERPAHNPSSAPPMVEVVSLRNVRRVSVPGAPARPSVPGMEALRDGNAPPSKQQHAALAGRGASSPSATESEPAAVPAMTHAGLGETDLDMELDEGRNSAGEMGTDDMDNGRDSMTDDAQNLPPPSVETPLEPERRVARRVSIEVDVGVSSESNFFTGFSGDISEGGLFIATYNLVAIGSHVHVSFGVMGREISCDATVCWIRDPIDVNLMPGFGVRFGELSDSDHEAIAKFINARAPMFYDDD